MRSTMDARRRLKDRRTSRFETTVLRWLLALAMLAVPGIAVAQARLDHRFESQTLPVAVGLTGGMQFEEQPPTALGAVVGGTLGAALGIVGGALMGIAMECGSDCSGEWDGFVGAVFGAAIGETIFMPIGVHVGNGQRGSLEKDLLASLGAGTATVLLATATESGDVLLAGMIAQLAFTVVTERSTGRALSPPRSLSMSIQPLGPSRVGAGASFRF